MGRHSSTDAETDPRKRSSRATDTGARQQHRRKRGGAFVAFAAAFAILLGLGVTGWVLFSEDDGCGGETLPLDVAVATDLAPAIQEVAEEFNSQEHGVDGACVEVAVQALEPADVTYGITGHGPTVGDTESHVWIPDSSLWPNMVKHETEEEPIVTTGTSVANSPIVLAVPRDSTEESTDLSWDTLVPTAATEDSDYNTQLIEPTRSSSGLATLALIHSAIGGDEPTSPEFIAALQSLQKGVSADREAAFQTLSGTEQEPAPVLALPEQSVWRYNADHEDAPAHVSYPSGGTYSLDYPYVQRSEESRIVQASEAFRNHLLEEPAQSVIRDHGFRSDDGTVNEEIFAAEHGFTTEPPKALPTPSASAVASLTKAWNQLKLGSRMLTLVDISGSMAAEVPGTDGMTRMQVTSEAAVQGLELFPPDAEMGQWQFSEAINDGLDYRETVPLRRLGTEVDDGTHREMMTQALRTMEPVPDGDTGLYDTILAAYEKMVETYKPDRVNTILVLTDGKNEKEGGLTLEELLSGIEDTSSPDKPVNIIVISFGPEIDPEPMEKVARATDGAAYATDDPTEIGDIFLKGFALRVAAPSEETAE